MSEHLIDSVEINEESKIKNRRKNKHPDKPLYQPPKSKNISKIPYSLEDDFEKNCHHEMQQEKNPSPDENDLTWDSLYDDNGDIVNDLNNQFGIDIKSDNLLKAKSDYSKFCNKTSSTYTTESDSAHILEIYGISPDLKTHDLTSCLSFNFKNFEIDWVDDTHALVTFQSSLQASEALNKAYPIMKLRPLSQATNESKLKAKKLKESGLTRKLRPETSAITARRLVIGALGIKANLDPEQRQAEREKLRLAKEKKQKSLRQAKNIWNGDDI